MKIRIRVLIPLIIFVIAANAGKLTEKENEDRMKNCGKVELPTDNADRDVTVDEINEKYWIVRVHNKDPFKIKTYDSLGSFISRKHIITSVQPIMTSDQKWSMDDKQWDKKCIDGHVAVPEKYVKNLDIRREYCAGKKNCVPTRFQPVQAWVLKLCEQQEFDRMYAMMIVEVKESDVEFGCLANQLTHFNERDTFHIYGIDYEVKQSRLRYTTGPIKKTESQFVTVWRYKHLGDRGGPMVIKFDNKQTIIGIGASPGYMTVNEDDPKNDNTEFFNIHYFQDDICSITGICGPGKIPPTPRTTKGITTVTQTTPITTNTPLVPTNQSPGTVTPANPTTPRPIQPRTPEINRRPDIRGTRKPDEDYTDPDYDKIEGGEDEDEEEEDFLVSADFLNGSGKMGLNFLMFVAVLAMVLVY